MKNLKLALFLIVVFPASNYLIPQSSIQRRISNFVFSGKTLILDEVLDFIKKTTLLSSMNHKYFQILSNKDFRTIYLYTYDIQMGKISNAVLYNIDQFKNKITLIDYTNNSKSLDVTMYWMTDKILAVYMESENLIRFYYPGIKFTAKTYKLSIKLKDVYIDSKNNQNIILKSTKNYVIYKIRIVFYLKR